MYVCICKAVTDHQIHEAVAEGCASMRDLQVTLGVAATCGKCAPCAKEILTDALHDQSLHTPHKNVTPIRVRTAV